MHFTSAAAFKAESQSSIPASDQVYLLRIPKRKFKYNPKMCKDWLMQQPQITETFTSQYVDGLQCNNFYVYALRLAGDAQVAMDNPAEYLWSIRENLNQSLPASSAASKSASVTRPALPIELYRMTEAQFNRFHQAPNPSFDKASCNRLDNLRAIIKHDLIDAGTTLENTFKERYSEFMTRAVELALSVASIPDENPESAVMVTAVDAFLRIPPEILPHGPELFVFYFNMFHKSIPYQLEKRPELRYDMYKLVRIGTHFDSPSSSDEEAALKGLEPKRQIIINTIKEFIKAFLQSKSAYDDNDKLMQEVEAYWAQHCSFIFDQQGETSQIIQFLRQDYAEATAIELTVHEPVGSLDVSSAAGEQKTPVGPSA